LAIFSRQARLLRLAILGAMVGGATGAWVLLITGAGAAPARPDFTVRLSAEGCSMAGTATWTGYPGLSDVTYSLVKEDGSEQSSQFPNVSASQGEQAGAWAGSGAIVPGGSWLLRVYLQRPNGRVAVSAVDTASLACEGE